MKVKVYAAPKVGNFQLSVIGYVSVLKIISFEFIWKSEVLSCPPWNQKVVWELV
jgi:hypothetical protein